MPNAPSAPQTGPSPHTGQLPREDTEKLLYAFNETTWPYPQKETLVSLFLRQAELYPSHPAVIFEGRHITYLELDQKSNQLAHLLLSSGVHKGMLVPVWLDRSLEWVIAILGIVKAGATYVPIDPAYPQKRVAYILEDTGAQVLVTGKALRNRVAANGGLVLICPDQLEDLPVHRPDTLPEPHTVAYTIYTSGSTGHPKGVMVTHHSIQHLVSWHNQHFQVEHNSRLSLVAGLAFDISVWETWSALTAGATLYIAHDEERSEVAALGDYYSKYSITHGFVPTVLTPSFVAHTRTRTDLSLRYLFTAGEQLKPVLTDGLDYELIDYYGPTECTVYATCRRVKDVEGQYVSSIGKPVANTQVYILDEQLTLLPIGATGELYIGGVLLANGYLNKEDLTAARFIAHPFREGERLYRTGDLARWLPDGNIQFLGRTDSQVKIRGFRVEPGEVERALSRQEAVQETVVITMNNAGDHKYLVAFVLPTAGANAEPALIRHQLKQELPGYMIPARVIVTDKIPLTENGKVAVHLLREMAEDDSRQLITTEPPTNETEQVIADIWSAELDRSAINITDNFFDIGGDSLQVAVVATAMSKMLDLRVYMRDLYQYPVLQELASVLIARRDETSATLPEEDAEPHRELQQDVYLAPGTVFAGGFDPRQLTAPRAILLTGVTGFVGIHLLQELLDTTTADIYCLVRAQDEFHAMEKIEQCCNQYHIARKAAQLTRVIPVVGDLTKHLLGLSEALFRNLAGTLDLIYHSGSSVNFIEPYSYMKAPNVEGLREIIRLAGAERSKCLALLSTISVYSWGHVFTGKTVMLETDDIAQNLQAVSKDIGYVRSKWVMEAIADLASEQGLPVITYRLGYAMCHSVTGASAPYQWWAGLVKNCIEYSSYPQLDELREGLITVDYMTRAMAHITQNKAAIGKKFNLIASPETNLTLEDFFGLLRQHYPFKLKGLPYKEWRRLWEEDSKNRLYPLTSLFKDNMHKGLSTVELYQQTYVWDCSQVTRFLEGSGIEEPVFDKRLLDAYLQYLDIPLS